MKSFRHNLVVGKEITAGLDSYGFFHIGPTGMDAHDATCSILLKTNEDRVALGRFLITLGSQLATPKQHPSTRLLKKALEELKHLNGNPQLLKDLEHFLE